VRTNGGRFSVGLTSMVSLFFAALSFGVTYHVMRTDVEQLKAEVRQGNTTLGLIQQRLQKLETSTEYLRDEIGFLRSLSSNDNPRRDNRR
jgi:septal ring factor EnvC (AmiA/AmiB activator)